MPPGADINAYGGEYGSALKVAGGHFSVVQILFDNGSDVNAQALKVQLYLLAVSQPLEKASSPRSLAQPAVQTYDDGDPGERTVWLPAKQELGAEPAGFVGIKVGSSRSCPAVVVMSSPWETDRPSSIQRSRKDGVSDPAMALPKDHRLSNSSCDNWDPSVMCEIYERAGRHPRASIEKPKAPLKYTNTAEIGRPSVIRSLAAAAGTTGIEQELPYSPRDLPKSNSVYRLLAPYRIVPDNIEISNLASSQPGSCDEPSHISGHPVRAELHDDKPPWQGVVLDPAGGRTPEFEQFRIARSRKGAAEPTEHNPALVFRRVLAALCYTAAIFHLSSAAPIRSASNRQVPLPLLHQPSTTRLDKDAGSGIAAMAESTFRFTHCTVTQYHFYVALELPSLSFITFQGMLLAVVDVLHDRLSRRVWRYCWILTIFVAILISRFIEWNGYFMVDRLYGLPVQCTFDKLAIAEYFTPIQAGMLTLELVILIWSLWNVTALLFPNVDEIFSWIMAKDRALELR
ncbi:hypothetical protein DL765_004276 [Monosporascus sp. GIB2]|nr:hypothetical protein DL765_004276 [Monosporascus sp. GIB2]